ncbi:MAG: peptide chain release factor 1 [Myxococcota bacterium]
MFDKLDELEKKFDRLTEKLADPKVVSNPKEATKIARERSELEDVVAAYRRYKKLKFERDDAKNLLKSEDGELRALAQTEFEELSSECNKVLEELKLLLLPKDPNDERNVILEIRAGAGGDEAGLFAAELFRMYARYAEGSRWKTEIISSNETGLGGFKEIIAMISGKEVYSHLKYESGVHRVQRVPTTESSGRIHTSTVTVAVLPEAEDVEIEVDENDLRIDVFRSSGPGGQSVNTTDSAVRITHIPTGIVVSCQDEKSQHKNKAKGLKVLKARLLDMKRREEEEKRSAERRSKVGTGERAEKIRTYNFPQNRVTDHRIGLTSHNLTGILNGNLDDFITALRTYFQAEALKEDLSQTGTE